MYHCPDGWSDGLDIDFRSADFDTSDCLRRIEDQRLRFDIVLVDPWHEYQTSYRDLTCAFGLLEDDGTLIVHDCLPPDEDLADPNCHPGDWCGVTYKAYLDFVTSRNDLVFCTIDTDYGCGVIRKGRGFGAPRKRFTGTDSLVQDWRSIGNDFPAAFRFYEQNKSVLLNVMRVDEFLAAERASARWRFVRRFARRWS